MGELYRPSNGCEGADFMDRWCGSCQHDADYDDECDGAGCEIAARSLAFNLGDEEYPTEWVMGDRGPICTAWTPLPDPGEGRLEDPRQLEIFADA